MVLCSFSDVIRRWSLLTYFARTRSVIGTPDINATSFLFEATRTPICQSLWYPGGFNALCKHVNMKAHHYIDIPFQKIGAIVEAERGIIVLHIVGRQ